MKRKNSMGWVARVVAYFCLTPFAVSICFAEQDWATIEHARQDEVLKLSKRATEDWRAKVAGIVSQADGSSVVRFHAYQKASSGPDGREVYKNASKDFVMTWKETGRPMPWAVGTEVESLRTRGTEVLMVGIGWAYMKYFRKRPDGEVEILAVFKGRALLIHANLLGCIYASSSSLDWVKGAGIVYTVWEAGGGDAETEVIGSSKAGIVPANAPMYHIQLGRDGWKDCRILNNTGSDKDTAALYREIVPPPQRIYSANCY